MATRTLSQASLEATAHFPPAKRGPGYRTIPVASYSSSSSDGTIEIPDDLNSREFLAFCGFSSEAGDAIWRSWTNRETGDDLLFDDAIFYIEERSTERDAITENDDWDSALKYLGMSSDARQRILNPAFTSIRLTGCACSWALDTVEEAFHFLQELEDAMEKKRRKAEISRTSSPDETRKPRRAIHPQDRRAMASSSTSGDTPMPVVFSSSAPTHIEGRTWFYKGGAESRLRRAINEDGSLNLRPLQSRAPTDFHPEKATYLYFIKHREVAIQYAGYAECRLDGLQSAIFQIAIPNNLLADGQEVYGDDWRDLVWYSKNTKLHETTFLELPPHIKRFEECDILISSLCRDSIHKVKDMADKSELSAYRLANRSKASQHVIQTISRQKEIAQQSVGFFSICLNVSPG